MPLGCLPVVMISRRTLVTASPHATFLETYVGPARARIDPAKLLKEFLPTMEDAETALDLSFGREPLAAFVAAVVEESCYSRQSLLPDGLARHITESEPLADFNSYFASEIRNC